MLMPLLTLPFWPEEIGEAYGFVIPAGLLFLIGILLWKGFKTGETVLTVMEGGVIVLLCWVIACVFSAFPLMLVQNLNFTQAVFESVSGWTTTGLSVVDVTKASHMVLFWRSVMQLVGGAGLAIIMLAAITGPTGPALSTAEGRSDQLVPHVRQSAKLVMMIYLGYIFAGIFAYVIAGMGFFDALNHSIAAVSTGGFSTRPESIGYWDSLPIESITLALMILGNMNFVTSYLMLHGKFKAVGRNGEMRLMAVVIPVSTALVFLLTCQGVYPTLAKDLRVAIFETVSALTTTGFSTVSYVGWNSIGVFILNILMLIGGGTCSTAGGIKQYRVYMLAKSLIWEIKRPFLPKTAVAQNHVWEGENKVFVSDIRLKQIGTFVFLYMTTYFIGAGILMSFGYGIRESLFEYASALSTVGLSIGVTAPDAPSAVLWAETIGMFLGRLEFFVIFISLAKMMKDSILLGKSVVK